MRNGLRIWLPLLLASSLAGGCRRNDLVENELRARDVQYREALDELMRSEATVDGLRRENDALRAGQNLSPELAAQTFGVRRIVLGRGTGGIDNDRIPGDEGLQVWVEPRDADDHTIKAPGKLQIAVLEINSQGQKSLLSDWEIGPDQLRQSWKQGLLSIGYRIDLAWKTPPRVETLRVVARWTLPDNRIFEADKDIKVRLVPGAAARPESLKPESPTPNLPISDVPAFRPTGTRIESPTPAPIQQIGNWTPVGPRQQRPVAPHWQPAPLADAVTLSRPHAAYVPPTQSDLMNRPPLGEIGVGNSFDEFDPINFAR